MTKRIVYVENQQEIGAFLSYLGHAMNTAVSFHSTYIVFLEIHQTRKTVFDHNDK